MTCSSSWLKSHWGFALAIPILCCAPAFAATVTVPVSYSGYYISDGTHLNFDHNYFSGTSNAKQINDFFLFDLTGVSGTLTAATFNVFSYSITAAGTYTMYATSLPTSVQGTCSGCVATYTALTSGSAIGSISVGLGDAYSYLAISLNAAGLNWLTANEGNQIVMGGSFPQNINSGTNDYLFGLAGDTSGNNLTITSGAVPGVPEPSTVVFMGSGALFLLAGARRLRNRRG